MDTPVSSVLVGRAGDLAALEDAFADDQVHTVLVCGEAGIGKSRLAAEFTSRLGRNVLVLVGRCPELGTGGVPFAPFVAVLRSVERQRGIGELAALLPPNPALARLLPQLATRSGPAAPDGDQARLFGEILTLLEQMALDQPVVLVLEDLHWADTASLELIAFLAANLAQGQALLLCTYRPATAGQLRTLTGEMRRNRSVRFVSPLPLTRHEVGRQLAALLGREPDPGLTSRVFARSGGNPLFVEALSQSPDHMPDGLTDLLLTFQSGLRPGSLGVLRAAAVIGSPVRHELLAEAAGLPGAALREGLRELTDRGLLLAADAGYEFRHVLIRQAVYDDLLPVERAGLHRRLAEVLHARPGLVPAELARAELAHHAAGAGDLPQALTGFWEAAAAAGTAGAQPQRLRHLERVLELWDRVPQAPRLLGTTRAVVLEHIVDACTRLGAVERGIEAAGAALASIDPRAEPQRSGLLHYRRACLLSRTGAGPGQDLERALELLPGRPPTRERGEALAELAIARIFSGDASAAAGNAQAAARIAEQLGLPALACRAHAYLGLTASAQPDTAASHFARAYAAASAAGDPQAIINVVTWESSALLAAGDYQAAISSIQRGLRVAHESFRFTETMPVLLVKWCQALTATGRWPEALNMIDESGLEALPPLSRAALLLCHAKISLAQGNTALAQSKAAEAGKLLGDGQWAHSYRLQLQAVLCLLALHQGNRAHAADILTETARASDVAALTRDAHDAWPLVALAAQVPGAPADLAALADSLPSVSPVDAAHRAVFIAHRLPAAARWDKAASAWHLLGRPYDEAQSLLAASQAHATEGDRDAANAALRACAGIAAGLGAAPLADAAGQLAQRARLSPVLLPGPPRHPHGGTGSGTFGLTPRELEVLRLVARGLTNRQVGAGLFISANTAGVHISRILTKLGVATRTEAAAFAYDHGLLGTGQLAASRAAAPYR